MSPCTECRGSGEYRGLLTVEKCRACGGSGTIAAAGGSLVDEVRALDLHCVPLSLLMVAHDDALFSQWGDMCNGRELHGVPTGAMRLARRVYNPGNRVWLFDYELLILDVKISRRGVNYGPILDFPGVTEFPSPPDGSLRWLWQRQLHGTPNLGSTLQYMREITDPVSIWKSCLAQESPEAYSELVPRLHP